MKTIKIIIYIMIWIIIGLAVIWMIGKMLERHEAAECRTWQEEAKKYEGYYITKWQAEQCKRYGIEIGAVVE